MFRLHIKVTIYQFWTKPLYTGHYLNKGQNSVPKCQLLWELTVLKHSLAAETS